MTDFDFTGIPIAPPPPPIDPMVAREEKIANDTRVESELNRFIAAKQDALFTAPDAYYRKQGVDAVDSAPQAIQRLHDVKDALVDGLANDYQRKRLGAALDAQMVLARDDIGRHAAAQSKVWQQQVALDRIGLLAKEAAFHRNDDCLIDVLSQAASTAARAHARVGEADPSPEIEDRAATLARSQILASALRAHIDSGNIDDATRLYDRVRNQLIEDHAQSFGDQIQALPRVDNIEVASYSDKAYAECQAECLRKYENGALPKPAWFSGSDMPSLMRICIRACLAEKGDHNY